MIYVGTILNVCDNSGVKWVQCLKILGRQPRAFGGIGDIVVVSVKKVKSFSKIKKKEIYKGVLVRTKKKKLRNDGSSVVFSKNSVVLLNNKGVPFATRIFGPVGKELRRRKFIKLLSLCSKVL